jgi:hypothetical protein
VNHNFEWSTFDWSAYSEPTSDYWFEAPVREGEWAYAQGGVVVDGPGTIQLYSDAGVPIGTPIGAYITSFVHETILTADDVRRIYRVPRWAV